MQQRLLEGPELAFSVLHQCVHYLPWKLWQRTKKVVCVCPEKTGVHHDPSRVLGDLTGIENHCSQKHSACRRNGSARNVLRNMGCSSSKICGIVEYKCDCGTLFSNCYFPIYICFVEEFSTLNYVWMLSWVEKDPNFKYIKPYSIGYYRSIFQPVGKVQQHLNGFVVIQIAMQ